MLKRKTKWAKELYKILSKINTQELNEFYYLFHPNAHILYVLPRFFIWMKSKHRKGNPRKTLKWWLVFKKTGGVERFHVFYTRKYPAEVDTFKVFKAWLLTEI